MFHEVFSHVLTFQRYRRQIREEADRIEVEWRRATATVMAEAKAQLHEASLALKKKEATKVNITGVSRPVVEDMVKKGNSSEDKKQDLSSISVGDTVYVGRLKKSVKVLEVFRDKSKIVVQAGPLKLTVPTHEITK